VRIFSLIAVMLMAASFGRDELLLLLSAGFAAGQAVQLRELTIKRL